ncbi:hypothetical protein [Dictyobacter aurantiacus]|uniref:Uncharacterized protein n=1 Tax=Dictyobacter aurantiacus TaxID=1936993 RepID=A0A401ZFX1_9CHLR|nr:hypothetical protein [Dictyobacter aurantiacus]GCE05767.1 hypothetical protein KDAU_30960 [Dictyobacter aurantiacus]
MHNILMVMFGILLVLGVVLALGVYRLRMIGVLMLSVVAITCAMVWIGHISIP